MSAKKYGAFFLATLVFFSASVSTAQIDRNLKRNLATVIFASIGGAVLGLSTLSFYGHPQDHTDNITAGALIGLAAGTGYVIYDVNRPVQTYDMSRALESESRNKRAFALAAPKAPMLRFNIQF